MLHLPVIVGFGGVNPAGRSSFHHAYRRLVIDQLSSSESDQTYLSLATMMGLLRHQDDQFVDKNGIPCPMDQIATRFGQEILNNTLIRKIDPSILDTQLISINKRIQFSSNAKSITLEANRRDLPHHIPEHWKICETPGSEKVVVEIQGSIDCLLPDFRTSAVQSAGQLPTGFDPGALYPSKNHPRSLQMTLYAASDAIRSLGIPWDVVCSKVSADQIGVYASASMGQLDDYGIAGYMKAGALGKRTSTKQLPLGFAEMPADFVNAYVLGSIGHTGGLIGACASFLYNMDAAVKDIQSGKRRVAVVGNTEAPITAEVIEGYRVMSALAEDHQILALDKELGLSTTDHRRACRPFGYNCGFTLGESAQFFVLFDDQLALELGASIHAAMGDSFVNSDGIKKSISAPGVGNFVTIAKAAAAARAIIGEQGLKKRSFIHAHGTGTPQNRVTESEGLNAVAKAFGIEKWPVAAVKAYLGHPIGTAAGDQMLAALGTWKYGYIPGIFTLDKVAHDVHSSNLSFSKDHVDVGPTGMDAAIINTKGFGGNNATGVLLGPHIARKILETRYSAEALNQYRTKNEQVVATAETYNQAATKGETRPLYRFGEPVLGGGDLHLTDQSVGIPGFGKPIDLKIRNPYTTGPVGD